jgi:hypothetical protein
VLFEKVLNLIHRYAPRAAICFNTTAVRRWITP